MLCSSDWLYVFQIVLVHLAFFWLYVNPTTFKGSFYLRPFVTPFGNQTQNNKDQTNSLCVEYKKTIT